METREHVALAEALREVEKEAKRYDSLQKKQQKLHKAIADAGGVTDGDTTLNLKNFNELKKLYSDLVDCCQRTNEAALSAKRAMEPLLAWQESTKDDETERKKAKMSSGSFKEPALPLWIGTQAANVPPPPLCGKVPFPAEARLVTGDLVAAMVAKPKEPLAWILCRVVSYTKPKYTVADVAPEGDTDATVFELSRKLLVPLPKTLPKVWDATTEFQKGDAVMAMFPGTTSFYEAAVVDVPSATPTSEYLVRFEDDDDEHGSVPERLMKPAFVVASARASVMGGGSKKH